MVNHDKRKPAWVVYRRVGQGAASKHYLLNPLVRPEDFVSGLGRFSLFNTYVEPFSTVEDAVAYALLVDGAVEEINAEG